MLKAMTRRELLELPVIMPLPVAARTLGIGRDKARQMYRAGKFPVETVMLAGRPQVTRQNLFRFLGMDMNGDALPAGDAA